MSETVDLPIKEGDDFIGEAEKMNMSELHSEQFMVAVAKGDKNKCQYLCSTMRGPYSFVDMVQEVGIMFRNEAHHACVMVASTKRDEAARFLSENTIDYIEANYVEIAEDHMFGSDIGEGSFTCKANVLEIEEDEQAQAEVHADCP